MNHVIMLHGKKRPQTNTIDSWMRRSKHVLDATWYDVNLLFVDNSWIAWAKEREKPLEDNINLVTTDTVMVWHSAGAAAIVRWLWSHTNIYIKKLILVAPWKIIAPTKTISSQTGEILSPSDYDGMKDLYNFAIDSSLKNRVHEWIYVITSNDEQRLLDSASMYIQALDAIHMQLSNRGHFNSSYWDGTVNTTLPELIDIITWIQGESI